MYFLYTYFVYFFNIWEYVHSICTLELHFSCLLNFFFCVVFALTSVETRVKFIVWQHKLANTTDSDSD